MSVERLQMTVNGVVQGVGFRYFVIQRARSRGLTGYVSNRRDGSVEVVAEGARPELEELLAELNRGPRHGIVRNVKTEWQEPSGSFEDFDVRF